jgi:hypothetical protein
LDRQDDAAATRLGSADVLQWLADHYPQLLGPIVYLFIFYELIDAYQNRVMKHVERAQLALQALFFMEMWEDFLEKAGYAKSKHFLLHEACDITRFLIHGLLQLIIIYCDNLDGVYPLLPWLLSTEIFEHVFGLCQQIIKDFTMLDFYYMILKLFIRLREHALFSKSSDGKERASGYSHTYTDNCDVDLVALSLYPSNEEINGAAKTAYEEAENLWNLLGAPPSAPRIPSVKLPSIWAWFTEQEPSEDIATDEENFSDYDSCVGDPDSDSNDEESESAQIQKALDYLETVTVKLSREENRIDDLALAAVCLSVGDGMAMYVQQPENTLQLLSCILFHSHELPEPDGEAMATVLSDKCAHVVSSIAACLVPVNAPDEPTNVFDINSSDLSALSFDKLMNLRRQHQTRQAATSIRTKTTSGSHQVQKQAPTERQLLLRRLNEVIKEQQEKGTGTGAERGLRWRADAPAAGNAANAAEAAETRHKKVWFHLPCSAVAHATSYLVGTDKAVQCLQKVRSAR